MPEGQAAAGALFQLPPDIADFTGRVQACDRLVGVLTAQPRGNAVVVCALSGKGGVGKTTLAVHVAHRVRRYFPDGQLYVDLRGVQEEPADPGQVLGRFLNELGVEAENIPERVEDRTRLYRARLATRSVLVVLDNAGDERQVRPLLPGNAGCAVLVTSRRRLLGLDGAHHLPLDVMSREQGRKLLAAVIGASRLAADPQAAADIVDRCGQLPLALRIAGARLASRPGEPLASYARRLADERGRLDVLRAGDLEVRSTFALSYQGCDEELRRAFRLLSVPQAPTFASWVLAALMDVPVPRAEYLLEQLVDAELLEISADDATSGRRYRFHDLLLVFAYECLMDTETPQARQVAAERVLREYVRLGTNAAALVEPGGLEQPCPAVSEGLAAVQRDPRTWLQAERAAFVSGVRLAFESELFDVSWRLAELLPALFRWQSDWNDWAETHRIGLEAAQRCRSADGAARIRCSLGLLYRAQGRFADAIAEFEQSITSFLVAGDELRAALARRQLGDTYRYTGRLHEGVAAFTASLPVFDRHRNIRMTAGTLNGLGDIYRGLSRWEESAACFKQCIALYESLDDRLAVARARVRFGILYRDRCCYEEAEQLYLAGLDILQELNDQRWVARALRHLGVVYRNTGRIPEALDHLDRALVIFEQLADHRGVAVTIRNIGDAHRYAGDLDRSEEWLSSALRRFQDLGDARWSARTVHGTAEVARQRRQFRRAAEHLDNALAVYHEIGDVPGQARVLRSFGILHRDCEQWQESTDCFQRSEALFCSLGDEVWGARAKAGRAAARRGAGDPTWTQLRQEAEETCRASGARCATEVESWLREW